MTRKDYEIIAAALRNTAWDCVGKEKEGHRLAVINIADALEETNPRFDRDRFIAAANA